MSANAEESDANQSKFYRVISSEPVTDADALFDTLSKFLMKDKKRQISAEYLDEKDQISSRLTWNNLRSVANSVLDEGCSQLDPVPAWIEQKEAIVVDDDNETPHKQETSDTDDVHTKEEELDASSQQSTAASDTIIESNIDSAQKEKKDEKKEGKKAKKEAKEARKRDRAEQRGTKKDKKEAKKLKKEAKKRKRGE